LRHRRRKLSPTTVGSAGKLSLVKERFLGDQTPVQIQAAVAYQLVDVTYARRPEAFSESLASET
jgi:hypothetical protein